MRRWLSCLVVCVFVMLAACQGCRGTHTPAEAASADRSAVRLYLISDFAGALEPCGCVKDQLGGTDHFGALVEKDKPTVKAQGVLTAGPLFFLDMELRADALSQETAKAQTIAASLKGLNLLGFAPGRNEWAAGPAELAALVSSTGAPMLAANLVAPGVTPLKWTIKEIGGMKLGLVGVAAPDKAKLPLEGASSSAAADAVKLAVEALKKDGAQAIIALAAVGRGEAKRIADSSPELLAIVVGSTGGGGDANTEAPPAERVGDVLIVETANHLQTVAVLDINLRNEGKGLVKLTDATGIDRIRKKEEITKRVDDLRTKIAIWENDHAVDKKDVDARKADVAKLEAERDTLDKAPPPATGSFYRYETHDIREKLGAAADVRSQMLAYYKQVNNENKRIFADRKAPPAAKGEASYVGIDVCSSCHEDARTVWDKTSHAHAYKTLSDTFKEFNLDCVSCHVTGYDRPGGSVVTHNENLQNVQCEQCHGPGSLHAAKPEKVKIAVEKPGADVCLSCHHPPHVHAFDAAAKIPEVLGPGHGRPK